MNVKQIQALWFTHAYHPPQLQQTSKQVVYRQFNRL